MYDRGLNGWMKHLDFMLLELIIIEIAFICAYTIRHPGQYIYDITEYQIGVFVLALATFLCFFVLHVHSDILKRGFWDEVRSVVMLTGGVTVVLLAYMYFGKTWIEFARLAIFYFIILSIVMLLAERLIWKSILIRYRLGTKSHIRHMFLITTTSRAYDVIEMINRNSYGQIQIVGMALADSPDEVGMTINKVPVVTDVDGVVDYISRQWVDELMVYLHDSYDLKQEILNECQTMGITTHVALRLGRGGYGVKTVEEVGGIYSVTESIRIVEGYKVALKRIMDISGSIVGLVITLLLTIFVGPAIFISDPGPIFYSQDRVGRNGRIFRIYKFRSMYKDADKRKAELMEKNQMQGLMFKMENDPRIIGSGPDGTKHGIGWFIRKTSIDEFPQFLNVLKGDMTLVGTRPPTVDEWEKYELRHRARLAIKPGLTGLWQAYGRNDITDFNQVIAMDMQYINTWSIAGDIRIILRTVVSVLTSRGAK